jgi:hypothetical protein
MFSRISFILKRQAYDSTAALRVRAGSGKMCGEICSGISASMTVEAAIAFPLFIFAMALILLPFRMMETTGKMQEVCEQICEDVCQYAYTSSRDVKELDPENSPKDQALYTGISVGIGAYAAAKAREAADDRFLGLINFIDSDCMTDGETVTIVLDYYYDLPFSVLGQGTLRQTVTSSRRAWIGKKRSSSDKGTGSEDDPLVYVGKNSTRYHLSASCHYLSNNLKTVSAAQIESLRNADGGKYRPCAVCCRSGTDTGSFYIMPSGTAYHSQRTCRAIISYVKTVHLSEVESLGACSYCSR